MTLIAIGSVLLALVMSLVAWRALREERRRRDARIAALASEIHGEAPRNFAAPAGADLLSAPSDSAVPRYATVVAAGAFVCATIGALMILSSREGACRFGVAPCAGAAASSGRADTASEPLELVSLAHERDASTLVVRGIVRNPPHAAEVDRLTAVVLLFGRDGAFLTSGRAAVISPALAPGGESAFSVTVPDAGDVGRYRVSFRTEDRVIPHVDRRPST